MSAMATVTISPEKLGDAPELIDNAFQRLFPRSMVEMMGDQFHQFDDPQHDVDDVKAPKFFPRRAPGYCRNNLRTLLSTDPRRMDNMRL